VLQDVDTDTDTDTTTSSTLKQDKDVDRWIKVLCCAVLYIDVLYLAIDRQTDIIS
jgi:hypothetical protein